MATIQGVRVAARAGLPGSRFDHVFFASMAATLTLVMVAGFAKTYFFAGMVRAKLPSPVVHIHGVIFIAWFVLLLAQSSLAALRRVDLHRKLGMAGVGIAAAMVPTGLMVTAEFLARNSTQWWMVLVAVMPLTELFLFATLAGSAFVARKSPADHKRLILLATIALMGAAVGRLTFLPLWGLHRIAAVRLVWGYTDLLMVPLVVYDLWAWRRVHRATLWGGASLIAVQQVVLVICWTRPWATMVHWIAGWGV